MGRDWSAALHWAADLDARIKAYVGGDRSRPFGEIYPVHDFVKTVMDALVRLERYPSELDCETADTLATARRHSLLSAGDFESLIEALTQVPLDSQSPCVRNTRILLSLRGECPAEVPNCVLPQVRPGDVLPSLDADGIACPMPEVWLTVESQGEADVTPSLSSR